MIAAPMFFVCFLIIVLVVFLVVPIWMILRSPLPGWQKAILGFNYYALLLIFCTHVGSLGSLHVANGVAKNNLETLIRILRSEPRETVTAALEEYLVHDEGSYYLLSEKFPEPVEKESGKSSSQSEPEGM